MAGMSDREFRAHVANLRYEKKQRIFRQLNFWNERAAAIERHKSYLVKHYKQLGVPSGLVFKHDQAMAHILQNDKSFEHCRSKWKQEQDAEMMKAFRKMLYMPGRAIYVTAQVLDVISVIVSTAQKSSRFYKTNGRTATEANVSRETVRRTIKKLEELGALVCQARGGKADQASNMFVVNWVKLREIAGLGAGNRSKLVARATEEPRCKTREVIHITFIPGIGNVMINSLGTRKRWSGNLKKAVCAFAEETKLQVKRGIEGHELLDRFFGVQYSPRRGMKFSTTAKPNVKPSPGLLPGADPYMQELARRMGIPA